MYHKLIFLLLFTSAIFAQSELPLLFDDSPPNGYEYFKTSDGETFKTSDNEYFVVINLSDDMVFLHDADNYRLIDGNGKYLTIDNPYLAILFTNPKQYMVYNLPDRRQKWF